MDSLILRPLATKNCSTLYSYEPLKKKPARKLAGEKCGNCRQRKLKVCFKSLYAVFGLIMIFLSVFLMA